MVATWGVSAAGWARGLNIITFVGLGSILTGMILARSILPAIVAHLFSLIIGLGWSFWVTSRLLPLHYTWPERWQNLAGRLSYWYSQAINGGTSYDNLMFILQMGVIVWAMGYLTIWFIFRSGKVWPAIVPGGVVLTINLYYAPNDITFWFLLYLGLSLLLVLRFNLQAQETQWRTAGIFFRPELGFDILRNGLILSLLVISLAWLAPPVVDAKTLGLLDEFEGSWRELQGEWNRLYADLNYRNPLGTVGTFGQSLKLGGPRTLTDEPVMNVQVDGVGRYWRAAVYDEYSGAGWRSNDDETTTFGLEVSPSLPNFQAREAVTQTYTVYQNGVTVLYTMANPVRLDRPAKVYFNALSAEQVAQRSELTWLGAEEPWVEEVTYMRSNTALHAGESYQVVSLASRATVDQLRSAGTDYPDWVAARYLQLPDSVTERTRQLARELTAAYNNPFDQAQAIERYLRAEIKYNEKIAAPPPGVEKVDYILFDLKEAYCDYYASSMIVMLRSLGIPARLAAGFAQGTYDAELDAFRVLNRDAHSWVEVYFPRYGWVEFEPTAAQPALIRPTMPENDGSFTAGSLPGQDNLPDNNLPPEGLEDMPVAQVTSGALPLLTLNIPWLGGQINLPRSIANGRLILAGLILLVIPLAGSFWWWQRFTTTNNIFELYRRMVNLASWLGVTMRPWQTPYEHAAILQRRLPACRREIEAIATSYVYQIFSAGRYTSPSNPDPINARETWPGENNLIWSRLSVEMLKAILKRLLPHWLKR